jgi:chromosome segregation protein
MQSLELLSGGERALVALAFLFALLEVNPAPFCLLDEVDAPLDEVNVKKFLALLEHFKAKTQFIVVTHSPITMKIADALYGVAMEEPGRSKVLSYRMPQRAVAVEKE